MGSLVDRMTMLAVTHHAVERFIKRWRPGMAFDEARAMLEELASHAVATRRKTLLGDARVYTSMTDEGEHVHMAVRDDTIVTVLDASFSEEQAVVRAPDVETQAILIEALDDHEAAKAARLAVERAKAQRVMAERTLKEWKAGATFSSKVLQRVRDALGLAADEPARLRFEGGKLDGVCIEVIEGEDVEAIEKKREQAG
jgi:hypothetical protein